jgi:hypothetical protein
MAGQSVVFDQQHTDCLLRLLLEKSRRELVPTNCTILEQEVLLSLVLFEKAYLVKPYWLAESESKELERLCREGVVDYIPTSSYLQGLQVIGRLVSSLEDLHVNTEFTDSKAESESEVSLSEARMNVALSQRALLYSAPFLHSALRHLRLPVSVMDDAFTSISASSALGCFPS